MANHGLGDDDPVLAESLAKEVDEIGKAQLTSLSRRQADQRLVDELRAQGFSGPLYARLEEELVRYALGVLQAWIYSGSVFMLLASRKMPVGPSEAELRELREDADARLSLAGSTVAVALQKFKARALEGGQWTVEGGASLTTYFMGATLYSFVNEFRRWRTERKTHLRQTATATTHDDLPGTHCLDPGTLVAATDAARRSYEQFGSDRIREMVFLRTCGYTHEEIAELLSASSARAVEGVFHRIRKAEHKRRQQRKEV